MPLTNQQYSQLMREYDKKQILHKQELERRTAEIAAKLPAYAALAGEVSSLSLSVYKSLQGLSENDRKLALARHEQKLSELARKKEELLVKNGYPADYLTLTYDCPVCKDKGILPDGSRCRCFKQLSINLLYKESGLGLFTALKEENFATLDQSFYDQPQKNEQGISVKENMTRIVRSCASYAMSFSPESKSLLFYGPTGTGKTFLSHCIAKALLDRLTSVVYVSAQQLFTTLRPASFSALDEEETEARKAFAEYLFTCDFLIIDDLGTELSNSLTDSQFFNLLNERFLSKRPLLISTNLSPALLRDRYGERIYSRMIAQFTTYQFFGKDLRIASVTGNTTH